MSCGLRVAAPPSKPLLVFDGDCHFCSLWVRRCRQVTGATVEYLPAQDPRVRAQFPEIPPDYFDAAIQLIAADSRVYSGAEAAFRTLAHNPSWRWLLAAYEQFPPLAWLAGRSYGFVAEHRPLFPFSRAGAGDRTWNGPRIFWSAGCFCGRWGGCIFSPSSRFGRKSAV